MAQSIGTISFPHASPRIHRAPGSWWGFALFALLTPLVLLLAVVLAVQLAYNGRIFPGVSVDGVPIGGLSQAEAAWLIEESLRLSPNEQIEIRAAEHVWRLPVGQLGVRPDTETVLARAYAAGRNEPFWKRPFTWWQMIQKGYDIPPAYTVDEDAIRVLLTNAANAIARPPQDARVALVGIEVVEYPAIMGRSLDWEASEARVRTALARGQRTSIDLVVQEEPPLITSAAEAAAFIRQVLAQPLHVEATMPYWAPTSEGVVQRTRTLRLTIDQARLAQMLRIEPEQLDDGRRTWRVRLDVTALRPDLEALAARIHQPAREARFDYDPQTGVLTPLVVSQDGVELDVDAALAAVEDALRTGQSSVELPLTITPPPVSTADASKFNITGVAAKGYSTFTGSPAGRKQNVAVAAARFNGVVIPPHSEFSFNKYLGWVVDAMGYEESYIILGNRTEVGIGGGVCQVSTTLFRAAFWGGFRITERYAHGYRVSYYEPPVGMDATVYSPYVDFKFVNDTDNYYLIESEVNQRTAELTFYLYGPDTGRTVQMIGPTILETTPALAPIYTEDPSLPAGVVEQVDWARDGAKVKVERIVTDASGNQLYHDVFWSNYRPWAARYLVGTGPSAESTPVTQESGER